MAQRIGKTFDTNSVRSTQYEVLGEELCTFRTCPSFVVSMGMMAPFSTGYTSSAAV